MKKFLNDMFVLVFVLSVSCVAVTAVTNRTGPHMQIQSCFPIHEYADNTCFIDAGACAAAIETANIAAHVNGGFCPALAGIHEIVLIDINVDGYMDIVYDLGSGAVGWNPEHVVYLWDPVSGEYCIRSFHWSLAAMILPTAIPLESADNCGSI